MGRAEVQRRQAPDSRDDAKIDAMRASDRPPGWATALVTAASTAMVSGQDRVATPPLSIGTIEIVSHEVFDEPARGLAAPFRVANDIHVRTRDGVIRRELLFAAGEPINHERLEQTERNLRGLPFLRDARVEATPVDEDGDGRPERMNIRVVTWDTWSLAPRFDFQQLEDRTIWEIGASEKNLFGFGKAITVSHRTTLDRTTDRVVYQDRQLAGSRLALTASLANLSDGDEDSSRSTGRFSRWRIAGRCRCAPVRSAGPILCSRTARRSTGSDTVASGAIVEIGRSLRRRPTSALRMHAAYRSRSERVGGDARDFGIVEVGVRAVEHQFVRLSHVNQFERSEDFNLGAESYGTVGVSAGALGGNEGQVVFLSGGHARGMAFRPGHFVLAGVGFAGRHERGAWRNALVEARLRYLRKHALRHALVGRVTYRHGYDLDPEVQLLLGTETGLRGYPVRQFAGTRSLLLSAEERWFVADDLGQLLSLGLAAFVDSGFAWPEGRNVDFAGSPDGNRREPLDRQPSAVDARRRPPGCRLRSASRCGDRSLGVCGGVRYWLLAPPAVAVTAGARQRALPAGRPCQCSVSSCWSRSLGLSEG